VGDSREYVRKQLLTGKSQQRVDLQEEGFMIVHIKRHLGMLWLARPKRKSMTYLTVKERRYKESQEKG